MRAIIASHNQHKIQEISELFAATDFEVAGLDALGFYDEIKEDQDSFIGNARLKAQTVASFFPNDLVIADDSGFSVKALKMGPGIHSARFLGEEASDQSRNLKILELLEGETDRRACFTCAIALVYQNQWVDFQEEVFGHVSENIQGKQGFGYDPIFIPEGYQQTFAQIPNVKAQISHRAKAFRKVAQYVAFFYS